MPLSQDQARELGRAFTPWHALCLLQSLALLIGVREMANSFGWMNGIGRPAGALLAVAAAFVGAGPSAGLAQTNIVVGIVAHGPPQWPHYVADQMGWLKDYGLTLDMVTVGAGTAQQLAGGSTDVAHS